MLHTEEIKRYNRHIILPEFGIERQELLKSAKILVIGAGGLGCPALLYLAAAGVGHITIIDPDTIEISNLQRQVLYAQADIGKYKALVAAHKLKESNPFIHVDAITTEFNRDNSLELISNHDLVLDGSDNFATRYLVNDACVIAGKPLVFGSIFKFEGQVSVFNYNDGPTYRCIYPEPPLPHEVPSCSEIGVIGVLPGLIGTMQATEAIKLITGLGEPLSGKLLLYDALSCQQTIISIEKNKDLHIDKLLDDYEAYCNIPTETLPSSEELDPQQCLKLMQESDLQIIDVREPWEFEINRLDKATLIPLNSLPKSLEHIDPVKPKLLYCHYGIRSRNALEYLKSQGFSKLYHLKGGIALWADELDPEMEKY